MTNKPPLHKFQQWILNTKVKSNKTTMWWEILNQRRRKDILLESSIDSPAYTQILQKQLNGRNHHICININTECQWTQLPSQKTPFGKLD
jgi:hypothetical protein